MYQGDDQFDIEVRAALQRSYALGSTAGVAERDGGELVRFLALPRTSPRGVAPSSNCANAMIACACSSRRR